MDLRREVPLESFTRGELTKLVTEKWIGRVTAAIIGAIAHSFATDLVLRPVKTQAEIRRRFRICVECFCILRRDLHWAVPHILDELPIALRKRLDGDDWDPKEPGRAWRADDGAEMIVDHGEDLAGERQIDPSAVETEHAG